jgi:hypothetical protein
MGVRVQRSTATARCCESPTARQLDGKVQPRPLSGVKREALAGLLSKAPGSYARRVSERRRLLPRRISNRRN